MGGTCNSDLNIHHRDNSSLNAKAVMTVAHLFYDLNWENCENEHYPTCVKHHKMCSLQYSLTNNGMFR